MPGDDDTPKLPTETETETVFKLTVATTDVTKEAIEKLDKKNSNLPKEYSDDNLKLWTANRREIMDLRRDAKKYVENLKKDIKGLTQKVTDDWEDLQLTLKEIEGRSDKLIKHHEKLAKEKSLEKKKQKAEAAAVIKKIDDEIQSLGNIPVAFIKSSSEDIVEEIVRLSELKITEELFGDRIEEAEMKKEVAIETLQDLADAAVEKEKAKADLKKREDELAEQKRKDKEAAEAEVIENKRVEDIQVKLKDLDQYIVKAVMAKTLSQLQGVYTCIFDIKISESEYEEFFDLAIKKHTEVLEKIREILEAKMESIKKEEEAQVEKDKIAKDKKDIEDREEKLRLAQKKIADDAIAAEEAQAVEEEEPAELDNDIDDPDFEVKEAIEDEPKKVKEGRVIDPDKEKAAYQKMIDGGWTEQSSSKKEETYCDYTGGKMIGPTDDKGRVLSLKDWAKESPDEFPDNSDQQIITVCNIALRLLDVN